MTPTRPAAFVSAACAVAALSIPAVGQESVKLIERFDPGHSYRVDVRVSLSGRLTLPAEKGKTPQTVSVTGASKISYDERLLSADEPGAIKAARLYREVEFRRVMGTAVQEAGIRPSVRRMVVLKAAPPPGGVTPPRRAPFSPDGPLTWNEIDVVRTDVFVPSAVPGVLPGGGAVRPGDTWRVTPAAVAELTDMGSVDEGDLTAKYVAAFVHPADGRRYARLELGGTVKGVNDDGPNRQALLGKAFFDLQAGMLTYLSIKGTHTLLDGSGQAVGTIEGQFEMTRTPGRPPADLADESLRGLGLSPTADNTLLLYDNPDLGARFLYPRSWRVGAVQGKQVTLDHSRTNAGLLVTIESPARTPTADDYRSETGEFLRKQQARVTAADNPARVRGEPAALDRFGFDAEMGGEKVRLEYAVLKQPEGGATAAARLPAAHAAELRAEVERIVRSLAVTRPIAAR